MEMDIKWIDEYKIDHYYLNLISITFAIGRQKLITKGYQNLEHHLP